jgi:hypothetical protein
MNFDRTIIIRLYKILKKSIKEKQIDILNDTLIENEVLKNDINLLNYKLEELQERVKTERDMTNKLITEINIFKKQCKDKFNLFETTNNSKINELKKTIEDKEDIINQMKIYNLSLKKDLETIKPQLLNYKLNDTNIFKKSITTPINNINTSSINVYKEELERVKQDKVNAEELERIKKVQEKEQELEQIENIKRAAEADINIILEQKAKLKQEMLDINAELLNLRQQKEQIKQQIKHKADEKGKLDAYISMHKLNTQNTTDAKTAMTTDTQNTTDAKTAMTTDTQNTTDAKTAMTTDTKTDIRTATDTATDAKISTATEAVINTTANKDINEPIKPLQIPKQTANKDINEPIKPLQVINLQQQEINKLNYIGGDRRKLKNDISYHRENDKLKILIFNELTTLTEQDIDTEDEALIKRIYNKKYQREFRRRKALNQLLE